MRELDGIRILGPADGRITQRPASTLREVVSAKDTGDRWSFGEVTAVPDERVTTHLHPGEPEAIIILEGEGIELHGAQGIAQLQPGEVVFIPPDTEHGLRTPNGGRWLAVWPVMERAPGPRYAARWP
jgi:quercetin dioxygenase-like cupin family protein